MEEDVAHRFVKIENMLIELADVTMGTSRSDLYGGGRAADGLIHKVDTLVSYTSNGGVPAKLDRKTKLQVAFLSAAIPSFVMFLQTLTL